MKVLHKHKLDFNLSVKYVENRLNNVNKLSCELLKCINFNDGEFFALLPNDAHFENLHEFENGGILQQNPEEEYLISGKKSTYSIIPTIDDELCLIIYNKLKK